MAKQKLSISDIFDGSMSGEYEDERNRLLNNYIFDAHFGNPNIKDFGEFKNAVNSSGLGSNVNEQDIINLFDSKECQNKIRDNVNDQEYEQLYGDGIIVERHAITDNKMVVIIGEKKKYRSYTRKGKVIPSGERFKAKSWYKKDQYGKKIENPELKFLKQKKIQKLSTIQIIKKYNEHFKNSPRTKSSIKHKLYRV